MPQAAAVIWMKSKCFHCEDFVFEAGPIRKGADSALRFNCRGCTR